MNILHITFSDILGQQFNGYLLQKKLSELDIDLHMAVHLQDDLQNFRVHKLGSGFTLKTNTILTNIENKLSLRCGLPSLSLGIYFQDYYKKADIVHLQVIHGTQFFSLLNIPVLSRQKPLIWTMHDPWLTTGHCVHSLGCNRWKIGCGECPSLAIDFPIPKDTTRFNWKFKKWVMDHADNLNLIVASQYMYDLIKESPITRNLPVKIIPFGVDTNVFKPREVSECRKKLGIPPDARVICFRSTPYSFFKGTEYAEDALSKITSKQPIWLITLEAKEGLPKLRGKYPIVELGWTNDTELIATALCASDMLLMPSIAEAFGMMAIEAMACGVPVIAFEGTSLPGVIHSPQGGIVVPMKDTAALANAIDDLLVNETKRQKIAQNALEIALHEYTVELYVKRHLDLYQEVLK